MHVLRILAVALLGVAACGDNLDPVAIDARPIDAPADSSIDGPCATGRYVSGELVDIDSSTASLAGVHNAVFTQRGGSATDTTSPNGRFEICVPATTTYLFDVDAPGDRLDAIAYLDVRALDLIDVRPISLRTMSATRAATFYAERGLTFDASKAHVLVFLAGDRSNLTLQGASHGTVQGGNDDGTPGTYTWSLGQGRYVLFPNVDATPGSVSLIGDPAGQHAVPVEAGTITLVALAWFFL